MLHTTQRQRNAAEQVKEYQQHIPVVTVSRQISVKSNFALSVSVPYDPAATGPVSLLWSRNIFETKGKVCDLHYL